MRLFEDYQQFAFCTIKENLAIARYCIDTPKKVNTNTCYGMPAIVLLASTIDIIGTFYRTGSYSSVSKHNVQADNELGSARSHFEQYHSKFLSNPNVCDRDLFLDSFYRLSRCRATHNGVLGPKVVITINKSKNGRFIIKKRELTHIFLNELYNIVLHSFKVLLSESKEIIKQENLGPSTGGTRDV